MSISPEQARAFATFLGYPKGWQLVFGASRFLMDHHNKPVPFVVTLVFAAEDGSPELRLVLMRVSPHVAKTICYERLEAFNGVVDEAIHGLQNVTDPKVAHRAVDLLWPGVRIIRAVTPKRGRPTSIQSPDAIRRTYQELLDRNGRRPNQDDVADALFVSRRRFKAQLSLLRQLGLFAWNELTALNSTVVNENERVG